MVLEITEEKGCLWYKVLVARYVKTVAPLATGGRIASLWLKNLISIKRGDKEGDGSWFNYHLHMKVGDGLGTLFWWDLWLDGGTLESKFSRLFYLCIRKMATVSNMFLLGWREACSAWRWRRRLYARVEELVRECFVLLSPFFSGYYERQEDLVSSCLFKIQHIFLAQ